MPDGAQCIRGECFHGFHALCFQRWWRWHQQACAEEDAALVAHVGRHAAAQQATVRSHIEGDCLLACIYTTGGAWALEHITHASGKLVLCGVSDIVARALF